MEIRLKIFLYIILFSVFVYGEMTRFVGAEYTTDDDVTVRWTGDDITEFFELKVIWIDVQPNVEYDMGRTSDTQMVISFPRSGHFILKIRAGLWSEECNEEVFSEWTTSETAEGCLVDGEPMGFKIFKVMGRPEW